MLSLMSLMLKKQQQLLQRLKHWLQLLHDNESACDLKTDAGFSCHDYAKWTKDYVQEQTRLLTDVKADPVTTSEATGTTYRT